MTNFSYNRFAKTLKWMVVSNWRSQLVPVTVGLVMCFILCEEMFMLMARGSGDSLSIGSLALALCIFVGSMWVYYGASQMFADFKNKKTAVSLLMLPASNAEKYAARWVYNVVLWALLTFAAFIVADVLRYGFNVMVGWSKPSTDMPLFLGVARAVARTDFSSVSMLAPARIIWIVTAMASILVAQHSVYILGSTLLRRHRFLLTSLFLFASSIVLTSCGLSPMFNLFFGIMDASDGPATPAMLGLTIGFSAVVTVVCYVVSYRLFVRSQLVNSKWLNI